MAHDDKDVELSDLLEAALARKSENDRLRLVKEGIIQCLIPLDMPADDPEEQFRRRS